MCGWDKKSHRSGSDIHCFIGQEQTWTTGTTLDYSIGRIIIYIIYTLINKLILQFNVLYNLV